jgi:predicted acetyltransferase
MFTSWFTHPDRYEGPQIDLVLEQELPYFGDSLDVKTLNYQIVMHGTRQKVGTCDLRVGMNEEVYYAGNIGYRIFEKWRGHGYAYDACLLLFDIAREKGMKELIITCSPDNAPSRKTLEKLGGELVETSEVPVDHWLYKRGETVKNIYRYQL